MKTNKEKNLNNLFEEDNNKLYQNFDQLMALLEKSDSKYDKCKIEKAYKLAEKAHKSQKRISGIPYILHPTSVAYILAELGMDTDSITAALLHDVVEDTEVSLNEIEDQFGKEVAELVDGVTKLGKIPFSSREEQQAENIRKMLLAMSKDIRVIIIKLADRLHNTRTLACMREQKRRDKSLENMEVFAPIAHRLGIRTIKEELEDLSLKYLDPIAYREIEESLDLQKEDRTAFIESIKKTLKEKLSPIIPDVNLSGRVKSINGIYRKMFVKHLLMEEIYDIYAVRVIVDTVSDCYNILGIIHDLYRPIPNRFKDYISTPKPNLYQSLHTTVIGKEGIPFEVQIRTWEMHHTAEYGIAAHWKYKLGINSKTDSLEQRLMWIKNLLENQDSNDSLDILSTIKSDLVPEEVFVLTPRGDVINLPSGATVIDFAYAIHSEVGNHMIGAKVDKRIVPFEYQVKTGQIVEIITSKDQNHGPSRDWLKIVKTSQARNKIRQWFKKERREENIVHGKQELEKELKRINVNLNDKEMNQFIEKIAKSQRCSSVSQLYESIGYGGIQLWRIMPKIRNELKQQQKKDIVKPVIKAEDKPSTQNQKHASKSITIEGVDNCLVKLSKCCNPIPGDEIIGYITRGSGVSIHKRDCLNVPKNIQKADEPERWLRASWEANQTDQFKCNIQIISLNKTGMLAKLTLALSAMKVPIQSLSTMGIKGGKGVTNATLTVNNMEHLQSIMTKLLSIEDVISVERI